MWIYEKKLQYPINIRKPNPMYASIIVSQLGGPDGELGAALRYLNQRFTMPYGEVIGILAAQTPGAVRSGMEAALAELQRVGFEETHKVPYLAHTVSSVGTFLAKEAGVPVGSALAYLIAPPLEGMYAMDAAMKAADVKLCKLYSPPSETNFGGGLLSGTQSACDAACGACAAAVAEAAERPVE